MESKYVVTDIQQALHEKLFPAVTMWNRQEGRPRTDHFSRALKAEVRDALWMLTRQWQLGEFQGDDAGTPVMAKVHITTSSLSQYKPGNHSFREMNDEVPLEALVEQKQIRMNQKGRIRHLDLRLEMGQYWLRLISDPALGDYKNDYKIKYPFELPAMDTRESDFVYSHPESWQQLAAVAGRAMDGYELYRYLTQADSNQASDGIILPDPGDQVILDQLGLEFKDWFRNLYLQPGQDEDAWQPSYLEYQFSCAQNESEQNPSYVSKEYFHGSPDWYVFNKEEGFVPGGNEALKEEGKFTFSVLPAPVVFDGMPDTRWWSFEDRKTNFGHVKPDTTDLAKMLLLEFALVYANDWFIIPFRLPINTVASIKGFTVTNTFGETTWIEASGKGEEQQWQKWEMFTLSPVTATGSKSISPELLLPALTVKTQHGNPLEQVHLIRDEMANMVWAIESYVPMLNGYGRSGKETAEEKLTYHKRLVAALGDVGPEYAYAAPVHYLSMTQVPEHWIPFMPVHLEGDNRQVQLQRSKMLRIIEGDTLEPQRIEPVTGLLREGLDEEMMKPYFIHEEEVLRSGVIITQQFQRTRWTNGQVYTWFGAGKTTGRGEGSSGLAFDQLNHVK